MVEGESNHDGAKSLAARDPATSIAEAPHYRGLSRATTVPCCMVSVSDLKRLYKELSEKTGEALERHLSTLPMRPDQDPDQFELMKRHARTVGGLMLTVIGARGEQIVDTCGDPLNDDQLPETVHTIVFDSAAAFAQYNVQLPNRFRLTLDFTEPPGLHAYNPWEQATPNRSLLEVVGPDRTWVTAVHETVLSFFRQRGKRRRWLHSRLTFNVLHWLVGFPGGLWVVYRLDTQLGSILREMHGVLRGAIYVYIVVLSLLFFRFVVGICRWAFPLIELEGARSKKTRRILTTVFGSLALALLYDILKTLFR